MDVTNLYKYNTRSNQESILIEIHLRCNYV